MAKSKEPLYFALVGGYHTNGLGMRRMAVTTEKPSNVFGRDLETGMSTHRVKRDIVHRFATEAELNAAVADAKAAHDAGQPAVDAANEAWREAQRAQSRAVKEAIAKHVQQPMDQG